MLDGAYFPTVDGVGIDTERTRAVDMFISCDRDGTATMWDTKPLWNKEKGIWTSGRKDDEVGRFMRLPEWDNDEGLIPEHCYPMSVVITPR